VLPNPLPSSATYEVSGADILVHIYYTETLITGGSPTLTSWYVTGLATGGNPSSIDVLANEIKLTFLTDSMTGTVEVDQTLIDNAAKTVPGVHVGTYADLEAPLA